MGDFNSNIRSSVGRRLLKVARDVGLENVIKEPIHGLLNFQTPP